MPALLDMENNGTDPHCCWDEDHGQNVIVYDPVRDTQ